MESTSIDDSLTQASQSLSEFATSDRFYPAFTEAFGSNDNIWNPAAIWLRAETLVAFDSSVI